MKKIILGVLFFISCLFANEIKFDMNFTKDTSCEIRKIKLYQNPIWASKIEFKNGKNAFFCSPKSMFEFYFNEEKWKIFEIESQSDFTNILITDYKTSKIVDAKKAFFVYGSSKISPAGDDLVAFESKEDASNYSQNNNGKRIFSFSEVKNSLIRLLNGRI
ncbi:MAG: nitrous oxide reductase accessory protein NosL [Aliarcobacter sp.]|jgi:nitrous oxide reductase accessory protein NosL|nr:nitrous oxide reductase accessory protein NosL [Aliarcobacter sp.]